MAAGLSDLQQLIDRIRVGHRTAAEVGNADGAVGARADLEIVRGAAVGAEEIQNLECRGWARIPNEECSS